MHETAMLQFGTTMVGLSLQRLRSLVVVSWEEQALRRKRHLLKSSFR